MWRARAEGIVENAPHLNIVAVKTIKGIDIIILHMDPSFVLNHLDVLNVSAVDGLWSELNILLKIKPHLNICNLLGFCQDEG